MNSPGPRPLPSSADRRDVDDLHGCDAADDDADFASAAMLRLIHRGLARQGLALPSLGAATPIDAAASAHVRLADKRALLQALWTQHGATAVFRIGEAVLDAPDEPTLTALLAATGPLDLVRRFQRLERYVHARHRVVVDASGPGLLRLRHRSLKAGAPPLPAEDLVVWGLLAGVLQRLGTPGLATALDDGTAVLQLRWQPQPAQPPAVVPAVPGTLAAARAQLAADCGAPWTVPRLAAALGLAPRTLQRRLALAGSRFDRLCTEVRLAQAARQLAGGPDSTAQIGFGCGFADQPHFTRCFRQHTALTPAAYRREFGRERQRGCSGS